MATAIWDNLEKRWIRRETKNGIKHKSTSSKAGRAGQIECNKRMRTWLDDNAANRVDWKFEKCWTAFTDMLKDKYDRTVDGKIEHGESYYQNETYGRLYLLPLFEKRKVSSIMPDEWQKAISTAKPQGRTYKDKNGKIKTVTFQTEALSKKTLSNLKNTIMMFCRYANMQLKAMDYVPSGLYVPESAPTVGKVILQPEMLERFLEPSDAWYIHALRFEVFSGFRPGEVLGLKREDYKDGSIIIRRARNYRNRTTTGKNKNAQRTVVLQDLAINEITLQLEMTKDLESDYIFCGKLGEPGTQKAAYKSWQKIAKERDLPGSPYSLRHTFASITDKYMSLNALQDYLGHSVYMNTRESYVHEITGDMQESAKVITLAFESRLKGIK